MSELAVKLSADESGEDALNSERRIVAYFDHEFVEPSLAKLERDIAEMTAMKYTNVVLCITEKDIASQSRMDFLSDTVAGMNDNGLEVWADPWSVGGMFGGEGGSPFSDSGERGCMHNPNADRLIRTWLDKTVATGIEKVFWDEPEMKGCPDCKGGEVKFLEKYTAVAARLALRSITCLTADEARRQQLVQVGKLPDVIEIGTDPYYPNPFPYLKITEENRLAYIERWVDYTRQAAREVGIDWHIWVQTFGIPENRELMIDEHIDTIRRRGVGSIAVWGFHGCESVPSFVRAGDVAPQLAWRRINDALART